MVFIFLSERFYGHVQLYFFTYECVFYYVLGQRSPNKQVKSNYGNSVIDATEELAR